MRYLSVDHVIRISVVEAGPDLLLDRGLLESAVARPQQSVGGEDAYPDVHTKAAALLESLVLNHAFVDGNKRTSITAVGLFYSINGWWLTMSQSDMVQLVLDVVEGRLRGVDRIAPRLAQVAQPLPLIED